MPHVKKKKKCVVLKRCEGPLIIAYHYSLLEIVSVMVTTDKQKTTTKHCCEPRNLSYIVTA